MLVGECGSADWADIGLAIMFKDLLDVSLLR